MKDKRTKQLILGGLFDLSMVTTAGLLVFGVISAEVAVPVLLVGAAVYSYFGYKTVKALRSR